MGSRSPGVARQGGLPTGGGGSSMADTPGRDELLKGPFSGIPGGDMVLADPLRWAACLEIFA